MDLLVLMESLKQEMNFLRFLYFFSEIFFTKFYCLLIQVNGNQLHGLSHEDVVPLLKDLPLFVQLVCARKKCSENANHDFRVKVGAISSSISSVKTDSGLPTHGSISSLTPSVDRLVKAKSDGSLAISSNAVSVNDYSKFKSRSLEPITGLAMWSSEAQIIELIKGDRGLGFSILDYQVCYYNMLTIKNNLKKKF